MTIQEPQVAKQAVKSADQLRPPAPNVIRGTGWWTASVINAPIQLPQPVKPESITANHVLLMARAVICVRHVTTDTGGKWPEVTAETILIQRSTLYVIPVTGLTAFYAEEIKASAFAQNAKAVITQQDITEMTAAESARQTEHVRTALI